MQLKAISLSILLALATIPAHAVNYDQRDKRLHTGASFIISSMAYGAFRARRMSKPAAAGSAILLTLAVGAFKETRDKFWDDEDMHANAVGAFTAPLIWVAF